MLLQSRLRHGLRRLTSVEPFSVKVEAHGCWERRMDLVVMSKSG